MQNEVYKECPYCGKLIESHSTRCVHCNHALRNYEGSLLESLTGMLSSIWADSSFGGKCVLVIILFVMWSILDNMWFEMSTTSIQVQRPINPEAEYYQEEIAPQKINIPGAKITLLAKYSLSGLLVAKNSNFFMPFSDFGDFNKVVPIDYGIAWGKLSNKEMFKKHCQCTSSLMGNGARQLSFLCDADTPLTNEHPDYVKFHFSHNHIIPANKNIKRAIFRANIWDNVRLDGYLVDMQFPNGSIAQTSLSRMDDNYSSRGGNETGGACEIFYVTGIQIGNRYYK